MSYAYIKICAVVCIHYIMYVYVQKKESNDDSLRHLWRPILHAVNYDTY